MKYTAEEVNELSRELFRSNGCYNQSSTGQVADLINAAVKEAVESEHRRLLEICKIGKEENPPDDDWSRGFNCGTTRIEDSIRARGVKEG